MYLIYLLFANKIKYLFTLFVFIFLILLQYRRNKFAFGGCFGNMMWHEPTVGIFFFDSFFFILDLLWEILDLKYFYKDLLLLG